MKPSILVAALTITTIAAFGQSEKKINSTIKEVTVFLQGAQVTRTATVELKTGRNTIVLAGTSSRIMENSIQAEINQGIKIVGVSFRINHMEDLGKPEHIKSMEAEKLRFSQLIKEEKETLAIYEEEETMLKANKSIGGEQNGVNVNELRTAVDYYRIRLLDIHEKKKLIKDRISSYEENVNKLQAQLTELNVTKAQPQGEIVIKLENKSDTRAQLKVSYLVQQASWFPKYDIRAKDIQSPIAVAYKASISQTSGEDWNNVKLVVSSGNPSMTGAKPTLEPWILGAYHPSLLYRDIPSSSLYGSRSSANESSGRIVDEEGNPVPGANVMVKGTTIGTATDADGRFSLPNVVGEGTLVVSFIGYQTQESSIGDNLNIKLSPDITQLSEVVTTGYATGIRIRGVSTIRNERPALKTLRIAATPVVRQTDVEFTVATPYSIPSGETGQLVDMIEYEIPAIYEYYSAPKLDNDAFLTARLTNWDEYNFLEGEASLFVEGKYIGKTILDTRNTSDTLTLSLGRDRNVLVTREKKKELSSSQFVGSNRKSLFAFEISVRNKKAYPINIRIEDQLPVPNTKEISVDDIEHSNASKNNDTGVLTWNLKIEPGKTQKLDLKYEVKYPRSTNIILE